MRRVNALLTERLALTVDGSIANDYVSAYNYTPFNCCSQTTPVYAFKMGIGLGF